MPKNWCLQTVVLEKTPPESLLDSKEIKPVNLKGNQPWILIGKTDAEAEAPVFWSPDVNSQLIGKGSDAGKDWGQKEKRVSENEMAVWHYSWNGHELGQSSRYGEGQGVLVWCSPWGHKEPDTAGRLKNSNNPYLLFTNYLLHFKDKMNQKIVIYCSSSLWQIEIRSGIMFLVTSPVTFDLEIWGISKTL